jgi:predicted phosphoribosyltransferase
VNAVSSIHTFADRKEAGKLLAEALSRYGKIKDLLILALPRGGVPVAAEISSLLRKPLDVLVVRKLGVPGHDEVAMGAIAPDGVRVLSHELIHTLRLTTRQVDAVVERETAEIARLKERFCHGRPIPEVAGRTVLVVDDGAATGSTMSAAVTLLRHLKAKRIVVAIPVAPAHTVERLRDEADEVVVLREPFPFHAVGEWYDDFAQTRDDEVERLLDAHAMVHAPGKPSAATAQPDRQALDSIRAHAMPLTGAADDYDGLLEMIGGASVVLLGESTHGTHGSTGSARKSPSASSSRNNSTPWPSKPTGRMPTG